MSGPYLSCYQGMASRGTKHNNVRNPQQGGSGLGFTEEQRFLVWLQVPLLDQCHSATLYNVEGAKKNPSLKEEMMCGNGEPYVSENYSNKICILCFVRKQSQN